MGTGRVNIEHHRVLGTDVNTMTFIVNELRKNLSLTQVLFVCHHYRYSRNRPSRVPVRWASPITGQETKGPRSLHGEGP